MLGGLSSVQKISDLIARMLIMYGDACQVSVGILRSTHLAIVHIVIVTYKQVRKSVYSLLSKLSQIK